jgi:hypothetical protein
MLCNKEIDNHASSAFSAGLACLSRHLEQVDDKIKADVIAILEKYFPNGFRSDSPIELSRFRRFAVEGFGEKIALADEALTKLILSCGMLFNGKVYIVRMDAKERIKREIASAVSGGADVIFYGAFYARHEDWLFPASVISEEMLKAVIVNLYPQYIHRQNYLSPITRSENEVVKIKREALRVWGDDILLSIEQLAKRLPYIPISKITYALAQNGGFVWNSEGVYTHVGKVDITGTERAAIEDYVAAVCRKDDYASLSNIPLGDIRERNYTLSLPAIHNATFALVLSDKYRRRGKIITRVGHTLDALSIIKNYCRSAEKCSLQDLLDFERDLTGETHRWIPMEAGYAVMARTGEDTFIAEKYVRFDVRGTDAALDQFVTGNYLPLKGVTTFAAFPECNQAWNLFLLESYCRRFSQRFRFDVLSVNSKNAGTIVRKDCVLSYIEIMADAAARSGEPLEKPAIEEYLYSSGYLGKKCYAKIDELIQLAKTIREGNN